MHSTGSLILTVLIIGLISAGNGALQVLKYIPRGSVASDVLPQFEGVSVKDTGTQFATADSICVYGIWALYSTTNFGVGNERSTVVISVIGKNPNTLDCSTAGQIQGLRNVKSVRYLGNREASQDGVSIMSDAYILGGSWEPLQSSALINMSLTDISAVRMGSIAITGNSSWQFCSDPEEKTCICVDMPKTRYGVLFLARDTVSDTTSSWPLTVNNMQTIDRATCAGLINPGYPRSLWRTEIDDLERMSGALDFHEWIPSENANASSDKENTEMDKKTVVS